MNTQERKPYFANALGFAAFMFALVFMVRSCNTVRVEEEKTRQLQIQKELKK